MTEGLSPSADYNPSVCGFAAASSLNEGAFLRRFPLEDARRRYIRLRPQVRLADALEDKARGVDAHIVHINLHGGDRRVHEHGKRIIIKGQQRHVLRDLQSPAADVLQTVQRKMVVCAEQHLRPHAAGEQLVKRRVIQIARRAAANDLHGQLLLVHRLADTGQTAARDGVVLAAHDECHMAVALIKQVVCGDLPRLLVVHVHPANAAALVRLADHEIRKIDAREDRRELCREDVRVEDQRVRLPLLDNVADDLGRFLPGKRLEKERVPLLFEICGCAGDDLKHVRVFKRNVPVKVRKEEHCPARLARKALRPRVRAVAETLGGLPDAFLCMLGNGAAVVQRLGDRGDGDTRLVRHIIDRYRRRFVPPIPRIPMRRLCHGFLPFSREASRAFRP